MMRGYPGQRFRRPPPPKLGSGHRYTAEEMAAADAAADQFFESVGIPDGQAWIEFIFGPKQPYFVLNIGPEWKRPVPELPEHFEEYAIYSEPGRIEFA